MPRMPGEFDLGGLPSARSGRQIAQYDATPYGEGLARLGASIADAGNTLEASFERTRGMRDKALELNAQKSFLEFKANEDKAYADATRGMKPEEAVGFSDRYRSGYKERADKFAQESLALLEPAKRAEYDRRLFAIEDNNFSSALDYEQKEIGRQSESAATSTFNNIIMPKVSEAARLPSSDPRKAGYLKEAENEFFSLIDANPMWSEVEKAERKEKARNLIQKGFAESLPPEERVTVDPRFRGISTRISGPMKVGDKIFEFASGGRNRGAVPFGTFPINGFTSGSQRAAAGNSYRKDAFPLPMAIPDKRVGDNRMGILIHGSSSADIDQVLSSGCLAIPRDQWPIFKQELQALQQKEGPLAITISPEGAFIHKAGEVPARQIVSTDTFIQGSNAFAAEQPASRWDGTLDALSYDEKIRIAEGGERELARMERDLRTSENNAIVMEGDDLLFDGELTEEWVEENKDELSPTNYRRFKRSLQPDAPAGRKEEPREYLRIEDMVDDNPEEALEEARDAFVSGRIGKASYNTLRTRAKQAMGDEPENKPQQSPLVKSVRKNVSTRLKPRSNAHESEYVAQVEALEAFDDWVEKHPNASEEETRKFGDNLINETNKQRLDLGKRGLSLPMYIPAVIRPEAVTKQDIDEAMVRTQQAFDSGLISQRQFQDQAALLYRWTQVIGEEAK